MLKRFICIYIASILLLAGCARDILQQPIHENTQALSAFNKSLNYVYSGKHFPLTIENTNSSGEKELLYFNKPPKRVIAVWQNSIETLLALGVGDRIIAGNGVPDMKHILPQYQSQYSKIPYTGLQLLDLETTMMLEPDLIVGWNSTFAPKVIRTTEFWHGRGVNTFIASNSIPNQHYKTLQNEYNDILNLGKIFDKNEEAASIVHNMQQEIEYVTNKTASYIKRPRVLVIEFLGKNVTVYNEKTLAGNIVEQLNGDLLGKNNHNISIEQVVDYNPDVIFVVVIEAYYGREQSVVDRVVQHEGLQNIKCVKNKRVYPLPLYAIYSSGVRTLDGIKILSRSMYPELYEE